MPPPLPSRSMFGSLALIAVVVARRCRCLRLHGGMVLAPAPHAGQAGGCVHASHWRRRSAIAATMPRASALPACLSRMGPGRRSRGLRFSRAASIRRSGASISAPLIRTRRTRRSGCGAWDYGSRPRTGRNGAPPWSIRPFFPVSTPQAFYDLLLASASKDPSAMRTFAGAHPEITAFGAWAKSAPLDRQLRRGPLQWP